MVQLSETKEGKAIQLEFPKESFKKGPGDRAVGRRLSKSTLFLIMCLRTFKQRILSKCWTLNAVLLKIDLLKKVYNF